MDPSISISSFEVSGNQKTHLSLFENEFAKSCEAKGFRELEQSLQHATQRLRGMDIFSAMDIEVKILKQEQDRGHITHARIGVVVKVKEKNVPSLKAETFFGNEGNNVGASIQGSLRNISGFGDMLRLSYGTNSAGSKDTQVSYSLPSVTKHLHSVDLTTRIYDDNSLASVASFHKNALSMAMSVTSVDKAHKLSLQSVLRDEVPVPELAKTDMETSATSAPRSDALQQPIQKNAAFFNPSFFGLLQGINTVSKYTSPAVLALLSPSTKTSLTYVHTQDTRDSASHPTTGHLVGALVEAAVPPGSAQYLRTEVTMEKHTPLLSNPQNHKQAIVGSLCGSFATTRVLDFSSSSVSTFNMNDNDIVINKQGERKLCHMSDRYFLGGPLSLRGVTHSGAGPRGFRPLPLTSGVTSLSDNVSDSNANAAGTTAAGIGKSAADVGDALGGLTKITALAALSSSLPFTFQASEAIRTVLFLNGALLLPHTVFPLSPISSTSASITSQLFSHLRLSVGAGLSYSMGPARLELTYAMPLLTASHDHTKSFQIGVALGMNSSSMS